jgi:RNA polymerase sigma factor (sigma-70 family)
MTAPTAFETSQLPPARREGPVGLAAEVGGHGDVRAMVERRLSCERPRRLRYLIARLRSRDDAEDVLQDFTLKALQGAHGVRQDKIDAWLNDSLRNALFDRYRRDAARKRLSESATAEPAECSEPDDAADETSIQCLSVSIAELKPSYATVLRRADLDDLPLSKVAADLGLTTNNAAVRLHRAREMLRRVMHTRCLACPTPCLLAQRFIAKAAA